MSTSQGNHVKIVTPELATSGTQVFVDGVRVARVLNVEFRHRVGELPFVIVKFYPESVEIEGEAILVEVE